MPSADYAPLADETSTPSTLAARVTRSGTITYNQNVDLDHGDLGEMPRYTTQQKGKTRAPAWDLEQGSTIDFNASESYPPVNNEQEEERRIQAVGLAALF